MQNTQCIVYGENEIVYNVLFKNRKTMEIAVHPDCNVVVTAPKGTAVEQIRQRVLRRARWIMKQMSYFQQFQPRTTPRRYIGGETHLYFGRQYRLKLIRSSADSVKLSKGCFWVGCKNARDSKYIQKQMDAWYRVKAEAVFKDSVERCWPVFARLELTKPDIQIRSMKTRWGSLSKNGILSLNLELIKAPKLCIDYVITHELCHLKHHDHGQGFYGLLERVMPDWKERKHRLELSLV